ncbi:MAG: hypothetical protein LBT09_10635 [Planctomycetaceae bacterium]|jgi:hypothetical protein|nr:hypothetical protein [Planctomycetaceae bacterium]
MLRKIHTVELVNAVKAVQSGAVAMPEKLLIRRDPKTPKYYQIVSELGLKMPEEKKVHQCDACVFFNGDECVKGLTTMAGKSCEYFTEDF